MRGRSLRKRGGGARSPPPSPRNVERMMHTMNSALELVQTLHAVVPAEEVGITGRRPATAQR